MKSARVCTIITLLYKQLSLFETANSHDKDLKFQFKIKQFGGKKKGMDNCVPPPNTIKEDLTPILLGLMVVECRRDTDWLISVILKSLKK